MIRALRLVPLALLLAGSAAWADHPFILPSSTSFAGESAVVTFDAAASDHVFFFDHRPLQLASIVVSKPDGTPATPYNTLQSRFRSVFDLKLDQQGTWKVASTQTMIMGSFKQNGEERRVGGRGGPPPPANAGAPPAGEAGPRRQPPVAFEDVPADATELHLTQIVGRVETFVTAGAPTNGVFKPTGSGLELDPITHPNAVAAGETARFRFLIDGKPAPGVKITVLAGGDRYRDDAGAITLTTGADGVVAVKWPSAGQYWLGAETEDTHASAPRVEKRRLTYAATLEVMTP